MKASNRLFLVFILLMNFSPKTYSQQLVRSAMVSSGGDANILDYTFGETFTSTMISANYMLTLGMQQMDQSLITSINEVISDGGLIAFAYPNPTSGEFILKINSKSKGTTIIRMYSALGNEVFIKNAIINIGISEITINPGSLSAGIYILTISSGNMYSQLEVQVN